MRAQRAPSSRRPSPRATRTRSCAPRRSCASSTRRPDDRREIVMPLWMWFVDSLVFVFALLVLLVVGLLVRRRFLARSGGTFEMSINRSAEAQAKGWMLGLAVYRDTELEWFRTFSLSPRPTYRFTRGDVHIDGRREPVGHEVHAIHAGHLIVATDNAAGVRQFAMSANALTGLLSWLESSPPGQRVNNVL